MSESRTFPRITLVTPSFNQAAFLPETLDSVVAQQYPDLEHIVMDGGSADGSIEILRRYESHLACWTFEKDGGQADALNRGFARGTGAILGWLNSDDVLLPGALKAVGAYFASHPQCDFLTGDGVFVSADGTRELFFARGAAYSFQDLLRFDRDKYLPQPAVFFSSRALVQAGELDRSLTYAMDLDFWLRMRQKFELHYLPQCLAKMRIHADAKSQHAGQASLREVLSVIRRYWGHVGFAERVQIFWGMRMRMARAECAFGLSRVLAHDAASGWRAWGRALERNPLGIFSPEGQRLSARLLLPKRLARRVLEKP